MDAFLSAMWARLGWELAEALAVITLFVVIVGGIFLWIAVRDAWRWIKTKTAFKREEPQ